MNEERLFIFGPVVAVLVVSVAVVGVVAWLTPPDRIPAFHQAQIVRSVIGGHVGQVIRVRCKYEDACFYDVRFNALQLQTDTRLLGDDGPVTISPLSEVRAMREHELRAP